MDYPIETFTDDERAALTPHFTNLDRPVFALVNLPETVGAVHLLKVGHHGSRSATSDAWLSELRPRDAVISVGRNNTYGHPAPEVLARLARHDIAMLRTDESGTITFSTDGEGARIRSHHD